MAQHINEEKRIAYKKEQSNYVPLTDYFMMWMLTFGRTFTTDAYGYKNDMLEDTSIYSWNEELIPWGYIEELSKEVTELRLTDKAMALLNERANNVS